MDVNKLIDYWRKGAEDSLVTMDSLFEKERYHHALFFGHLALEKTLKALYVKIKKEHAPYTHSLVDLAKGCQLALTPEQQVFLAKVVEFNLSTRYPKDIQIMSKEYNREFAQEQISQIKHFISWLNLKLEQ